MIDIGALEDFESGAVTLCQIQGRDVAVVRWGDDIYALGNKCPHHGGPLCQGHLGPRVHSSRKGTIELDESRPTLACSWHGWEFDLGSGAMLWDERFQVRTYPVTVTDDGRVQVDARRRRPDTPRRAGRARAGT
jgi:nitrite reductase/ring-hydroxylating ferredoxin subunit